MRERTQHGKGRLFIHVVPQDPADHSYDSMEFADRVTSLVRQGDVVTYPASPPTSAALCDAMDSDSEGDNYHDMVGVPDTIVSVLKKHHVPRKTIDAVMLSFYQDGGIGR